MRGDIHIHSKYSPDSSLEPDTIVKFAKNKNLDFIAISDHNVFRKHKGEIPIIPAEEVSSIDGHILALFIDSEVKSGQTQEETVDAIHDKNGIAICAHPFRMVNGVKTRFKNVYDAIETKNGRCLEDCNCRSAELAKKFKRPETAGSDSHFYTEIGRVSMVVDCTEIEGIRDGILKGRTEIVGKSLTLGEQVRLYYKMGTEYVSRGFKRL